MATRGETVLIVDGDGRSRAEIVRALERAGYTTVDVGSAAEAIDTVRTHDIALVVLELELPDMTGYEVCRDLRDEHGEGLPIFFMSGTRTEALDRVAGLLLGADDFIVKPFDRAELVARVHRFTDRRGPSRQRTNAATRAQSADPDRPHLTEREHQILIRLAHGGTQKQIADELSISPKTVATHIQNLFRKLDAHSRAELVARAWVLDLAEAPVSRGG
jgi:DNA-binding NarL/FixJ family response regulator